LINTNFNIARKVNGFVERKIYKIIKNLIKKGVIKEKNNKKQKIF